MTEDERKAIASRVGWLEPGILLLRELPSPTPDTVAVMFDEIAQLTRGHDHFAILVDLSGTERPGAELREQIRARMMREGKRISHCAMFTGTFLVAVAAKFIFGNSGVSISTHKQREDALKAVRRAA